MMSKLTLAKIMIGAMGVSMVGTTILMTSGFNQLLVAHQEQSKALASLQNAMEKHVPVEYLNKVRNEIEFSESIEGQTI